MSSENSLLNDAALPAFSSIRAADVVPAIDAILAEYHAGIDRLTTAGAAHDFDHVMLEQERLDQRLSRAWAPVSHLHAVADTPELRAAYEQAEEKITDFASGLGQNRALYAAVQARSEEHTSELQSPVHLVCRLLLEKKKKKNKRKSGA